MCGVCGYRSEYPVALEKMAAVLSHRGPDDSGFFQARNVGLGHKRLAIIDLKTGHQPMLSADGKSVLVFNGEIYNFLEIKEALTSQGFTFQTASDTEVLLRLYERYGTDCLKFLNGEFAFVIYDRRDNTLFGARDRLGIKPFYYTVNAKGFFFASEIKALLACGHVSPVAHRAAIDLYLTYRYIPGPKTIYKNIHKVPPGHAFVQTGDQAPRFWKYWDLPAEEEPLAVQAAQERFKALLTDSVRYRLISDVPLGVFLSGGIDSTTLVALMSQLKHQPIRSFTIGGEAVADEAQIAQSIAQRFGCDHHPLSISPSALDLLPKIIWHMDEPFADPILIPAYCLSRWAAREVKVVLTGEGADEGQMGYIHHEALRKGFSIGRSFPPGLLRLTGRSIAYFPVAFWDRFFNYPASMGLAGRERLSRLAEVLGHPGLAYQHFCSLFVKEERQRLYGPGLRDGLKEAEENFHGPLIRKLDESQDPLRDIYIHEIKHWLPDNILNKQDRMTMAHSLEGRVPYLDHRLVAFEAGLPLSFKIKGGQGKYLLKCIYHNLLGAPAPRKSAFFMPLDGAGYRAYQALVDEHLDDAKLDGYLWNKQEVKSIIRDAERSPLLGQKKVLALVMFQIWREVFKPEWD